MRPSLSTTGGDKGKTGLFGGKRVSKADVRMHAIGTVDELNAVLGLVLAEAHFPEELRQQLHTVQKDLFCLGADLSASDICMTQSQTVQIEQWGLLLEGDLPALQKFILPSGCRTGALLHLARTICRRAERWLVALSKEESVNSHALIYINRLSDYFFLLSRTVNKAEGSSEQEWLP